MFKSLLLVTILHLPIILAACNGSRPVAVDAGKPAASAPASAVTDAAHPASLPASLPASESVLDAGLEVNTIESSK